MSKNERVMDYLLDRIDILETQLALKTKGFDCLMQELKETDERCNKLSDELDQCQMEREHIKEIITCHIAKDPLYGKRTALYLIEHADDFKTLLSIIGIEPGDYLAENPEELDMSQP